MASLSLKVSYLLLIMVTFAAGENSGECQESEDNFLCHCQTNCSGQDSKMAEISSQQKEQKQLITMLHNQTISTDSKMAAISSQQEEQKQLITMLHNQTISTDSKMAAISSQQEEQKQLITMLHNQTISTDSKIAAISSQQEEQKQLITMLHSQTISTLEEMVTGLRSQQRVMSGVINEILSSLKPKDCAEIQREGHFAQSGVYTVYIGPNLLPVRVFCDLEHEGGGWLVFQRRKDGSQDFRQNWDAYARGFGDLLGEFWLGNDFLHLITRQKDYRLRVDLGDFEDNTAYAEYSTMKVGRQSEKYKLLLGNYSGGAGDAMTYHSGKRFSTIDQDNDGRPSSWRSCSSERGGAGWWFHRCDHANLNGMYLGGANSAINKGVLWEQWKGREYSLKTTVMKVRPANY